MAERLKQKKKLIRNRFSQGNIQQKCFVSDANQDSRYALKTIARLINKPNKVIKLRGVDKSPIKWEMRWR